MPGANAFAQKDEIGGGTESCFEKYSGRKRIGMFILSISSGVEIHFLVS